jgi:hypothetical protein
MKANELTHIIRKIVAEEVKKQLPQALSEVFTNLMGRTVVTEQRAPEPAPVQVEEEEPVSEMKQSLRELFAGAQPIQEQVARPTAPAKKNFTKNPVLNDILNQTSPFSGLARQQMGGMSPAAAMAAEMAGIRSQPSVMSEEPDPEFLRNIPTMGGSVSPGVQIAAATAPVLREGQASDHIPLSNVPADVSALDLKNYAPPAVKNALSRNYSQMMKIIDKKRKGGV